MAMERGNIDLLVWPWVVAGIWLMCSSRWASAACVLAFAVYLKIFPLGAVTGAFAHRRKPFRGVLLTAAVSLTALGLEAGELARIRRSTPQAPFAAWGAAVIPYAGTEGNGSGVAPYYAGLMLLAAVTAVGLLTLRLSHRGVLPRALERARRSVNNDGTTGVVVSAGLGLTVLTYTLGTNSDYRLLVVTVLVAGLVRCWADVVCRRTAIVLVSLQYVSFPLGYPVELVGDLAWLLVVPGLTILATWLWTPRLRTWVHGPDEPEELSPVSVSA